MTTYTSAEAFIAQLATLSLDSLVGQACVCRELMDEEEDHRLVDGYRKQWAVTDAIGRLRFGDADWDDAFKA